MGISGLLRALRPLIRPNVHIKDFVEGCGSVGGGGGASSSKAKPTVVIDGYSFLHKAAYGCAEEICEGIQSKNPTYVRYFLHRCKLMRYHGVEPIVVFDGKTLRAKARQAGEVRKQIRQKALRSARELKQKSDEALRQRRYAESRTLQHQATGHYQRAISVSPTMLRRTIAALKAEKKPIDYVIAPYEADAQLGWFAKEGRSGDVGGFPRVVGIVSDDSDILLFCMAAGVMDTPLLTNFNEHGYCDIMQIKSFESVSSEKGSSNFLGKLRNFDERMFIQMAILAGCDYDKGIHGIGLIKAQNAIMKFARCEGPKRIEAIVKHLSSRKAFKDKIPEGYVQRAALAESAFYHQHVYDTRTRTCVKLNPMPDADKETVEMGDPAMEDYIGSYMSDAEVNDHQAMRLKKTAPIFENALGTSQRQNPKPSNDAPPRRFYHSRVAKKAPERPNTDVVEPQLVSAFHAGKAAELPVVEQRQVRIVPDVSQFVEVEKTKEPSVKPLSVFRRRVSSEVKPAPTSSKNPFLVHENVDESSPPVSKPVEKKVDRGPTAVERMKMRYHRSAGNGTRLGGQTGKRKRSMTLYSFFQQKTRKQTP